MWVIGLNLITDTILKEKNRIEYMLNHYYEILKILPKGSVLKRKINNQVYYYLKYREDKKVVSKYVGKSVDNILPLIEKRKHTEEMIKLLENELRIANKALEGI